MANSYNNGVAAGTMLEAGGVSNGVATIAKTTSALNPGGRDHLRGSTIQNAIADPNLVKVDPVLGLKNHGLDANFALNDRAVSNPSGMSVLGVPTWGNGKISRNTTYGADHERTTGGELSYSKGGTVKQTDYSALLT